MLDGQVIKQVLVAAAIAYLLYYAYWQFTTGSRRRAMIREYGCLPVKKYPSKDPFFGIDMFRGTLKRFKERKVLEGFIARFELVKVGTYTFRSLGKQITTTIEPENIKTMQALDFKKWALPRGRITFFTPLLGVGIFTSNGTSWEHSRSMLKPNFVRAQVGDLDMLNLHVSHLIDAIPRDGSMIDLQELFFRLTLDSATEFLFGESTLCLAPGTNTVSSSQFAEVFNRAQTGMALTARWGKLGRIFPWKQYKKDIKFIHAFIDHYVEKGLAKRASLLSEKPNDSIRYLFIDELVRQTDDPIRIRSELLNILLAGRDTTASLLSNVWWTLSKRPDVWARLREEVDKLNGEPPTYEQVKEFKYLRAVLNESLRLYPIVPINSREAVVDTTLPVGGGPDGRSPIFIRKGQTVTWSLYAMQRRKDYYGEDADEFRPERWLGENGLRPGWEYLPFNGGPRICIGQQFALTEASYTTILLMQQFKDIESRDPLPWQEGLGITCVGANGCKVALTPY